MSAVDRLKKAYVSSDETIRLAITDVKRYTRVVHGKLQRVGSYDRRYKGGAFDPASSATRRAPIASRNPTINPGTAPAPKRTPSRASDLDKPGRREPAQRSPHHEGSRQYKRSEPLGGPSTPGRSPSKSAKYLKGAKPGERGGPPAGAGTEDDPIRTWDVEDAAQALAEGKHVELTHERQVSTLIDKLADIVEDAKARGEKAPTYDLCKVTVKNTNLFCVTSIKEDASGVNPITGEKGGIPRVKMPQFKGKPTEGSPASRFPVDKDGEVDLTAEFVRYLTENDVTGDGKPEVINDSQMPAAMLKASQNELGGAQVAKIARSMEKNGIDPQGAWLWVSNDDYVIDGHHRWAAMVAVGLSKGEDVQVPVRRIDMDIISILKVAKDWTSEMGIQGKAAETARETARQVSVRKGDLSTTKPQEATSATEKKVAASAVARLAAKLDGDCGCT